MSNAAGRLVVVGCLVLGSVLTAGAQVASDEQWQVRVGPVWQSGGQLNTHLVPDQLTALVRNYVTSRYAESGTLNPLTGYADRTYNDGFVFIDPGTADPETYIPGLTWYWGYQSDRQYANGELAFHGGGGSSHSVQLLDVAAWEQSEDTASVGADLALSRNFWTHDQFTAGLDLGLSWFPGQSFRYDIQRPVAREQDSRWQYVDYFGVNGYTPPAAPYTGTYVGPGPLLRNQPDRRDRQTISQSSRDWIADAAIQTDLQQWEFRAGPCGKVALGDRVNFRASPTVRAACVEAESSTTVSVKPTSVGTLTSDDHADTWDWVMGVGLELAAEVELGGGWSVDVGATKTWWADVVKVNASPFETTVDLEHWQVSTSLGRRF